MSSPQWLAGDSLELGRRVPAVAKEEQRTTCVAPENYLRIHSIEAYLLALGRRRSGLNFVQYGLRAGAEFSRDRVIGGVCNEHEEVLQPGGMRSIVVQDAPIGQDNSLPAILRHMGARYTEERQSA
jgi:hypothetical protein